ncbi:MAG: hypothetical protein OXG35_28580, partial [Acidobacteria bacterium]|nr:hypothetical protein [Acidobacteriota bacterium]
AIARVRGAKKAADGGAEQGNHPEPAKNQQPPANPQQAPPQRPRNQAQPLTLDERIKFAAKQNKLTEAEFKNLQNFAKGNKETLLQLIETVGGSKKT